MQQPADIEWDDAAFEAALKRAKKGIIRAARVRLREDQLRRLLDAAPEDDECPGRPRLTAADFRGATFYGRASFGRTTFIGNVEAFGGAIFRCDADFRGATFSDDADFRGAIFGGRADFGKATFSGDTYLGGAIFSGYAGFGGAAFSGDTGFFQATFRSDAGFGEATFRRNTVFNAATFSGDANFRGAIFSDGGGDFSGATFSGAGDFGGATFSDAGFLEVTFHGNAYFGAARFGDEASFGGATFGGYAYFGGATFSGRAGFGGATFSGDAAFQRATFEEARQVGPLLTGEQLSLDGAVFAQPVRIELSARRVSCDRAVFRRGADVLVRWAEVSLEDADFAAPSLVSELPARHRLDGERGFLGWEEPAHDGSWHSQLKRPPKEFRPRVVSLRRAKVADLTLSAVDARACRFVGAHGLDELRLERVGFALPPEGWRLVRRWRPVRWTRRQTVAEERHWRCEHDYGSRWYDDDVRAPGWLEDVAGPPDGEQIAGVYRALRKSREDIKDEPGAADFYYGEMEMRRQRSSQELTRAAPGRHFATMTWRRVRRGYPLRAHPPRGAAGGLSSADSGRPDDRLSSRPGAAPAGHLGDRAVVEPSRAVLPSWGERCILWLYWLVAGYGLRASRALVALAITIALGAVTLDLWGFRPDRSYGRALLFALESSISLLRAPEGKLTASGEVIQIVLRLAGPLFFGLALLSLRGRVKR